MFFTLTILRFCIRMVIKTIAFPFKIVTRIVRAVTSGGPSENRGYGTPSPQTPTTSQASATGNGASTDESAHVTADSTVRSERPPSSPSSPADTSPAMTGGPSGAATGSPSDPPSPVDTTETAPVSDVDDGSPDQPTDTESSDEASVAESPEQTDEEANSKSSGESDVEPVATYRDELTANDPAVREAAIGELADDVADEAIPAQAAIDAIADRLDDESATVRAAACHALGHVGTSDVEPRIRDRRIDPDREVSRAASRALREIES